MVARTWQRILLVGILCISVACTPVVYQPTATPPASPVQTLEGLPKFPPPDFVPTYEDKLIYTNQADFVVETIGLDESGKAPAIKTAYIPNQVILTGDLPDVEKLMRTLRA
ncbi:MAG TPA: hypothetical protein VNK95_07795, partial [Caldilineaceae bacterium]|nr:hypothetical protein [Caldilineaceae bacterium]